MFLSPSLVGFSRLFQTCDCSVVWVQARLDLVYQLHELAERVQTPPERDYELAARLYAQGVALDPLNAALRYNAGSAYTSPRLA